MKGAFCVGGTAGGGYVGMLRSAVFDKLGKPVGLPPAAEDPPVIRGGVGLPVGELEDLVLVMTGLPLDVRSVVAVFPPFPDVEVPSPPVDGEGAGGGLLPCANTGVEKNEMMRKEERRSERFSESRVARIASDGVLRRREPSVDERDNRFFVKTRVCEDTDSNVKFEALSWSVNEYFNRFRG